MNKEEILNLSQKENKGKDLGDRDAQKQGTYIGFIVGGCCCLLVSLLRGIIAKENSFDVWFIFFSIEASIFYTKYFKMKKKHELATAIIYTALTIMEFIAFMLQILGVFNG